MNITVFGQLNYLEKEINFQDKKMPNVYITFDFENDIAFGYLKVNNLINTPKLTMQQKKLLERQLKQNTHLLNFEIARKITQFEYLQLTTIFKKLNITYNKKTEELIWKSKRNKEINKIIWKKERNI